MKRLFGLVRSVSEYVESLSVTPMEWVLTFFGITTMRFFFEAFSSRNATGYLTSDASTNVHFFIFYLVMTLTLTLILSVMAQRPMLRTANAALAALPIIWVAPIVDLLVTGGWSMAYIFDHPKQLLFDFLTFFGPIKTAGVTFGIKVELALLVVLAFVYVYGATRSFFRGLGASILSYLAVFVSGALPSILMLLGGTSDSVSYQWWSVISRSLIGFTSFHPTEMYSAIRSFEVLFNVAMMQCLFLALLVLIILLLKKGAPHMLRAIISNIRPPRLAHYLGLVVIGGYVAYTLESFHRVWVLLDGVTVVVALSSIALAWICAVAMNDIVDEAIDRISNSNRPLVRGDVSQSEMRDIAIWSGALAILGAYTLGSYSLYFISVYTASSLIYSMPPLRLKRFPVVSTFLLSIACLSATMLGFFLISQDRHLAAFPGELVLLIVIAFTLGMNWKDLKDIKGDSESGIMTLPTLLGIEKGKFVIGGLMFIAFMCVPIILDRSILILPSAFSGLLLWVGVVQGRGERYVFTVFFASVLLLLAVFQMFGGK